MKRITELIRAKASGRKLVVLTAYDALTARVLAPEVDALLVGDSVAMVVHGHDSTVAATLGMMALHTSAVRRGAPDAIVIADLPFLSFRQSQAATVRAARTLVQAGATAVKLEGAAGNEAAVAHLVQGGVPVMGHLGLTPQSVHQLGGYRIQGRAAAEADGIRRDAHALAAAGAFAVVLECVPASLARALSAELPIPVIGIGAGRHADGQVLVTTDLLGLDAGFRPRFARRYADGARLVARSARAFARDVRAGRFPSPREVPAP